MIAYRFPVREGVTLTARTMRNNLRNTVRSVGDFFMNSILPRNLGRM
jgi:hypothetical protein